MLSAARAIPLDRNRAHQARGFAQWLRTHQGAVAMAGLLAFAAPVTFFTGALSVMRTPTAPAIATLGLWWSLYGVSLWCFLLVAGYVCDQLARRFGRYARSAMWLLAACSAAALTNALTAGRAAILMEQGLVHSVLTMHLHGFTVSLVMALLYFAHLRRSREHEEAAARLAAAQTAQRDARRRLAEARLQEVQARIDPRLLFEMLDAVRHLYERDPAQAESYLDELIVFLRAALPRLRTVSSSLAREAELARAFVRLRALAGTVAPETMVEVDISPDAMHARFPPGVLLPLLDAAVRRNVSPCRLTAARSNGACRLDLVLGAAPSDAVVARVKALLMELYGTAAKLEVESSRDLTRATVEVPHEPA